LFFLFVVLVPIFVLVLVLVVVSVFVLQGGPKSKPTLSTHNFVKYWPIFKILSLRRHIFVCFMAKSAFCRGFSALAPYTGVGPI